MSGIKPIIDRTHEELVDALEPPAFEPTGLTLTAAEAIDKGYWLGAANVWLYTREPVPEIIYHLRPMNVLYAPGKLDVAGAGYYSAGERGLDGLRELEEELGVRLARDKVEFFNRRLNVGRDQKGRERKSVINVYIAEYNGRLEDMKLQEEEVEAVVQVELQPLLQVFAGKLDAYAAQGINDQGEAFEYQVTAESFPYNYDNYQQFMAQNIALRLGLEAR